MRQIRDTFVWLLIFSVPVLICYAIYARGDIETGERRDRTLRCYRSESKEWACFRPFSSSVDKR